MTDDETVWLETLERLLRQKETKLKRAAARLQKEMKGLKSVDSQIDIHKGRQGQPTVLVRRTPGPEVTIYHSAEAPCGRVANRSSFQRILLGAAVERGLRPCTACAWSLRLSTDDRRRTAG